MPHGIKLTNSYVRQLGRLYERCPKSVLAAIAVSALTTGGDRLEEAHKLVLEEWWALYYAGMVQQRPCEAEPASVSEE